MQALKKQLRGIVNWKAPGSDGVQGYWLKYFRSLKKRIERQLNVCLQQNRVHESMIVGVTTLCMKDKEKENIR